MATREQAIALAKKDTHAALACARDIPKAWYRCQALAWVARFAPDEQFAAIADEALKAAVAGTDGYQKVGAASWPIRALIERSAITSSEKAIKVVLLIASDIQHAGSRAEALSLFIQATLAGPPTLWQPVFEALLEIPQTPPMHWRLRRALRDVFAMVHAYDSALVTESLSRINDQKIRNRIIEKISNSQGKSPRDFFR